MPAHEPSLTNTLIVYAIVGAIVLFRYSRPMKMSLTRLFIAPVVFLALTVLSIYGTQMVDPAPAWQVAAAVAVGLVFGVPLGIAMSAHRTVRRTEKAHVMFVDSSWLTAAIWLGAFILKAFVRSIIPAGAEATIVGDGLLLFGMSALLTSYVVIYRKFRSLDAALT
jgi:membrane protein CcdC involved in cytochrome C biogenesis